MQTKTKFLVGFLVVLLLGSVFYFSDGSLFSGKLVKIIGRTDLKILKMSVDPQPVAYGSDVTASFVVKSTAATSGPTNVSYTLDGLSIEPSAIATFSSAGYRMVTTTFIPPISGSQTLIACVDQENMITETDEGNNCNSTTFIVDEPIVIDDSSSESGSLTISVSPNTPSEGFAVAGSEVDVSKFRFETTAEAFLIRQLSVNARQSGIANANIGDYDNNVIAVKITYTNSAGISETKIGSLTNGTAQFSGLDFLIERDATSELLITARVNTMYDTGGGATLGEKINLNIAFNNFAAVGLTSGNTYQIDRIDDSIDSASDLDFGPIIWTSGSELFELEGSQGLTLSLTVDNGSGNDNTNRLPVGALLCVDDNNDGICSNEDVYVVTNWPSISANTTDVVTVGVVNDTGDDSYDDEDQLMYALPGRGYLTGIHSFEVVCTERDRDEGRLGCIE